MVMVMALTTRYQHGGYFVVFVFPWSGKHFRRTLHFTPLHESYSIQEQSGGILFAFVSGERESQINFQIALSVKK